MSTDWRLREPVKVQERGGSPKESLLSRGCSWTYGLNPYGCRGEMSPRGAPDVNLLPFDGGIEQVLWYLQIFSISRSPNGDKKG